jgi:protein phosphatase
MKNKFNIAYSVCTSAGVKKENQDLAWLGFNKSNQCLAIICDGIGSEKNSDLASKVVLETFAEAFQKSSRVFFPERWFKKNLLIASNRLHHIYQTEKKQIGTTIVLCLVSNDKVHTFNIGDSRLYLFSFQQFKWEQKTKDHTLYNFLVEYHAPEISFIRHKKIYCL